MNNDVQGFACVLHRMVIKALFLLGCQTLCVMFQVSRAAHQLLGRLHTLFFRPSGNLRKLNGLELHLKMDQLYSPIY